MARPEHLVGLEKTYSRAQCCVTVRFISDLANET